MNGSFRQFKLTNGDEMVCELIDADEEIADIIVRRAMKIVTTDDLEDNVRYYTLKPWISFQDDSTDLVSLNSVHIISESTPSATMMEHYSKALADVDKYNAIKAAGVSINDIHDKMLELSEEEMEQFLSQKYEEINGPEITQQQDSSDVGNIIRFNPKGTVH
jgi:hypothetical protein